MSVIIRLQLLPLSANAADVRAFFSGLRIPDGAVHIVGGDDGDAFIGFATDEDARQAMRRDRGQIHGQERLVEQIKCVLVPLKLPIKYFSNVTLDKSI
ncbi:hypothetical protein ANCCEY_06042 [Ancylostoma ceylanicum]|uniref:RRM domain-containing protein n=1 Tax=Ancylostoma ceylanicum TaxID=53326 RepID=A0A0D6M4N6_9BILA|nr:hypothetical protein ANCCEY_06042 [Ancylostoma ceylanicum]